jgi:hypothetical protein
MSNTNPVNDAVEFDESLYGDEDSAFAALKQAAKLMGMTFHPSIGYDKLLAKYNETIAAEKQDFPEDEEDENKVASVPTDPEVGLRPETPRETEFRVRKEMRKLVRVEVQCLDPLKKVWNGEIITVANDVFTVRRMVPFNVEWHVEQCIAQFLEDRVYQYYVETTVNGNKIQVPKTGKAFSIKYLDPLTPKQMGLLAIKQARQGD